MGTNMLIGDLEEKKVTALLPLTCCDSSDDWRLPRGAVLNDDLDGPAPLAGDVVGSAFEVDGGVVIE